MTVRRPVFLWPVPRVEGTTDENSFIEFFIKAGAVYWPGGGGAEAGTGYVAEITGTEATLAWPCGYSAWRTMYRYVNDLCTCITAAVIADVPGFVITPTVSAGGVLTLTYSGVANLSCRFHWGAVHGGATSYPGAAAELGFDITTSAAYAASHTGATGHARGLYLASDSDACLGAATGQRATGVQAIHKTTIYGQVAACSYGGILGEDLTLAMLSQDQATRAEELWAYGSSGGSIAYQPDGATWADHPLGWMLGEETRQGFIREQPYPGLARYQWALGLQARA